MKPLRGLHFQEALESRLFVKSQELSTESLLARSILVGRPKVYRS